MTHTHYDRHTPILTEHTHSNRHIPILTEMTKTWYKMQNGTINGTEQYPLT